MAYMDENSQLDMLKDQLLRCDDELLIFLKRRVQTAKKIATVAKKSSVDRAEITKIMDEVHFKSCSRFREMGFEMTIASEMMGIIGDLCAEQQKKVFEK
jgi:chorismate mutase